MSDDKATVISPSESVGEETLVLDDGSKTDTNSKQGENQEISVEKPKTSKELDNSIRNEDENESRVSDDLKLLKEKVQVLEGEKERLLAEIDSWKDKYYRALAEYHNYQKRMDEKIKFERQKAQEEIILKILPIIDAIEKAKSTTTIDTPIKQVIKGYEVIHRQIQQQLNRLDITEIMPEEGASFNPELHEALLSEESDQHPEGTILQVLEKGYRFNSRVIRPARVKVARAKQ